MPIIICKNCGVEIDAWPYEVGRKNFCSRKCNCSFNMKGRPQLHMVGHKIWVGRRHRPESNEKNRVSNAGRRSSVQTEFKKGIIPWNKGIERADISGEKHPNWKGGITKESYKIRNSLLYKKWRAEVFKRDDYTCQICREREKVWGKLQADHIKQFAYFPELRFDINNGRTLCEECHKKTDTYLNKGKRASNKKTV